MAQSWAYRERRNAIAAWLRDRFGPDDNGEAPDAMFWADAADLLKFLAANGLKIVPVNGETPAPIPGGRGFLPSASD